MINGVFYANICDDCFNRSKQSTSSGHARWSRTIDGEDNEAAIQQPYQSDGSPNPKFVKLYPVQAAELFNEKQMRDAELK